MRANGAGAGAGDVVGGCVTGAAVVELELIRGIRAVGGIGPEVLLKLVTPCTGHYVL